MKKLIKIISIINFTLIAGALINSALCLIPFIGYLFKLKYRYDLPYGFTDTVAMLQLALTFAVILFSMLLFNLWIYDKTSKQ